MSRLLKMFRFFHRFRSRRALVCVCVLALVVGAVVAFWPQQRTVRVTAYFTRTVGIYPGSDVRVLGIPVGRVVSITPQGSRVQVVLEYDAGRKVPAGAKAAIINSSVVSDRYVQLLPVYRGGPTLGDGAVIPLDRTAVPVELDRVYSSLDMLAGALGPQGANADGSLSRLLGVSAANLNGQGDKLHQSVHDLSAALTTLASGRQDLFGTVRQLQVFTAALETDDTQVRQFSENLAGVSAQLAGERENLGSALKNLAVAFGDIAGFVRDNKSVLGSDLKGLRDVTGVLVKERSALTEFLDVAPTALSDLNRAYNPTAGTLDTRDNAEQTQDPALYLCSLLDSIGKQTDCTALRSLFGSLPKLPLGNSLTGQALPGLPSAGAVDKTLGGILGGAA
ncbi:MCE family protein [Streptacidiphilus pinicola]|nr:MCE family protein [Streptacidiphilus pinicola]